MLASCRQHVALFKGLMYTFLCEQHADITERIDTSAVVPFLQGTHSGHLQSSAEAKAGPG